MHWTNWVVLLIGWAVSVAAAHELGQRNMARRWKSSERFRREVAPRGTRMKRIRIRNK